MARLDNPQEMELIYQTSKQVYSGVLSASSAAKLLLFKTNASEASLKMYFSIYSCMRKGTCYKMGTSAAFTKYLIERIHAEEGGDSIFFALSAAKQNADFRKQCNNEQPGIEAVCREIIETYKLKTKYEGLDKYSGKGDPKKSSTSIVEKSNVSTLELPNGSLRMKIVIGAIEFEAEGDPKTVIAQHKTFTKDLLPSALVSLSHVYDSKQEKCNDTSVEKGKKKSSRTQKAKTPGKSKGKKEESLGTKVLKKYPYASKLVERMDFKAKMIPLMFLASEAKFQSTFSVAEIKLLMNEVLKVKVDIKQIKDVIQRRPDWFAVEDGNPIKYKLVDIGRDYAKNILEEHQ